MAARKQWVNVPQHGKYQRKEDLGQLGRTVRFELALAKKLVRQVSYRLVANPANATYTTSEKGRNLRFSPDPSTGTGTTGPDGRLQVFVELPAAGGDEFHLEGKKHNILSKDEVVKSAPVATVRRLFFQSVTMVGVTAPDVTSIVDAFGADPIHVELVEKGKGKTIPAKSVVYAFDDVGPKVKSQYQLKIYDPYAFVIAWVEYIAQEGTATRSHEIPQTLPERKVKDLADTVVSASVHVGEWLWHALDSTDDLAQSWLTSCTCAFIPDVGAEVPLALPKSAVKLDKGPQFTHGGYEDVLIALPMGELAKLQTDAAIPGKLRFALTFRTAVFSGGQSGEHLNLITIASKAMWKDRSDPLRLNDLVHEIGHKLGMVPDGTGAALDAPAGYYTGQGHNGAHCGTGATYTNNAWNGAPTCVMFGTDRSGTRPSTFCSACAPVVRKLDLGAPAGLSTSVSP